MGIKQETEMLKRSNGEKAVSVNDLVHGLESFKISNDTSKDSALNELLKNMKLDDSKVIEKPCERKPLPKEDDETAVVGLGCDVAATPDNLVRLEAPNVDDKEEDEEGGNLPNNEDTETVLGERGPMHGVPANYNVKMGYNHIAIKACKPYQLPSGFAGDNYNPPQQGNILDYGYQNLKNAQGKGGYKREMEESESYNYEPPKWIRPHHPGMEEINNLSGPCFAASSPLGSAHGKTVSQVYQKQMSGGIMYTPEEMPPENDHFLHGAFGSQELQDLAVMGSDVAGFNIPVDTDNFLRTYEPLSPNVMGIIEQGLVGERNQMINGGFHPQQWNNPQGPPGHMAQVTDTYGHCYPTQPYEDYQQVTPRHYPAGGHKKRGSFGNDDGSDGYASDLSPSHELTTSPTPSPSSAMDSSPAAMNGSPPRTNWSPPPSNMSYCSADSGVGSPMTEELNGYSSMKSPRQGHVLSPQSVSSVPGSSYPSRSPPLTSSPAGLPASRELQIAAAETENYISTYIDTHLTDLDCALEVASQDLLSEKLRRGYPLTPLQTASMPSMNNNSTAAHNMANIYHEKILLATQNSSLGMKATNGYMLQNPVMNGKLQSLPNLPTTVPATIQLVNKNMVNGQQAATSRINQSDLSKNMSGCHPINSGNIQPMAGTVSQKWEPPANGSSQINLKAAPLNNCLLRNPVQVSQPAVPAPLILTSPATSSLQPPVSAQGKIPIAPINQKPKAPGQSSVFLMTTNGTVTPVFIMSPNMPAKTPPRALRALAPKDPAKQNEKTADVSTKPCSGGNSPTSCSNPSQGDKSASVPGSNGKKAGGSSVEKLLNLARRLVAEMSTDDLKYKDEDGDTYLHVAVCRADKFMVQALLERLVRETLTEMIDKQNLQGQTPLYLAVSTNNAEMVQLLIEQGADVNPFAESVTSTGSIEKTAAIHCASTKGDKHLDTLLALLKAPEININQVNSEGHTALHCAILSHGKRNTDQTPVNSIPIIRALLQAEADPNLQVQQSGKTALMYALESRDLDLIESTFQLVDPQKLPALLKTQAFDSSSCLKIAESFKATLDPTGQQRLVNCLRPGSNRGVW